MAQAKTSSHPQNRTYLTLLQQIHGNMINTGTAPSFKKHRHAIYHIDSGANVHATNNKSDFITFHPIQTHLDLAAGSHTTCQGVGAILLQLSPHQSPILLAPVYYCPQAKVSTLSPSALKLYNKFSSITINVHNSLTIQPHKTGSSYKLPMTTHNNLDYITLPVVHFESSSTRNPMISRLTCTHTNEQYVHQKFDHRSMHMIKQMHRDQLMTDLPLNITTFHDQYKCPICLLTQSTKVLRNKFHTYNQLQPGELFCFDYSFWTIVSIRGFTSILSAICGKTRFSFTFPTPSPGS